MKLGSLVLCHFIFYGSVYFHILGAFICKSSYFSHGVKLTFGCVCLAKKVEREKYKDINNVKKKL